MPRGLLLVLAISAALGTMLFVLVRLRSPDRQTDAVARELEEMTETGPGSHRQPTVRPSLSEGRPLRLPGARAAFHPSVPALPDGPTSETGNPASPDAGYDPEAAFGQAAREFQVPVDLLKAVAYVESQGNHRHGERSEDGGYGVMRLRERPDSNTLEEAARLLQTGKEPLVRDPVQNIRGAAALIRSYYVEAVRSVGAGANPWLVAVTLYSGRPAEQAVQYGREIENILHEGLTHALESGQTLNISPGQDHLLAGAAAPTPAVAATPPLQEIY